MAYLNDARYDGFLPTVWLAFGRGEPRFDFAAARVLGLEPATIHIAGGNKSRLKQDEGMFFACSRIAPHPIVVALAEEARRRREVIYRGRRFLGWPSSDPLWKAQKWLPADLCYYIRPHVSIGSVHSNGWICQARYDSVLSGADPSQGLRVGISLPDVPPHKRRYEARGRRFPRSRAWPEEPDEASFGWPSSDQCLSSRPALQPRRDRSRLRAVRAQAEPRNELESAEPKQVLSASAELSVVVI